MASWKDNLTDAEVDALYKYKTEGKQALSDAEVELVYPYAQHLKQEKAAAPVQTDATAAFTKSAIENAAPAVGIFRQVS